MYNIIFWRLHKFGLSLSSIFRIICVPILYLEKNLIKLYIYIYRQSMIFCQQNWYISKFEKKNSLDNNNGNNWFNY
jgi:hypothetical protein